MLQGQVALRKAESRLALVLPGFLRVGAALFVPPGKESRRAFLRIPKVLPQNTGGVGEVDHVVTEEEIILNQVSDEAAKKSDVGPGPDWHPDIGQGARPRKPGVHMNDGCAAFLRFHHPSEADWMRLGH